ncbi:MAG: YitT family protein [Psychrilyobacter sp.]|uniref:YczE/YyaS/YitT family protein n=1 Tax=Psychrilyobacter sp. TaxID=2586924 RepID=UPI003C721A90
MKRELYKYLKLVIGCIIGSFGMVVIMKSNIGSSPWLVFQQGLGKELGMSIGKVMMLVNVILLFVGWRLGELFGSGTILNSIVWSYIMDLVIETNIVPEGTNLFSGIIMVLLGTGILSLGMYIYVHNGLGCGPRDALMVGLVKKTGKSVKMIRSIIEISVLILGYFMGGIVGVGTIIYAIIIGYLLQFIFKCFKFNINELKQRTIKEEFILLKNYITT